MRKHISVWMDHADYAALKLGAEAENVSVEDYAARSLSATPLTLDGDHQEALARIAAAQRKQPQALIEEIIDAISQEPDGVLVVVAVPKGEWKEARRMTLDLLGERHPPDLDKQTLIHVEDFIRLGLPSAIAVGHL